MIIRLIIITGKVGTIWARTRHKRRLYQTLTVIGYFLLLLDYSNKKRLPERRNSQIMTIGKQKAEIELNDNYL